MLCVIIYRVPFSLSIMFLTSVHVESHTYGFASHLNYLFFYCWVFGLFIIQCHKCWCKHSQTVFWDTTIVSIGYILKNGIVE